MGAAPWPDTIPADAEREPVPACRACGYTGRSLERVPLLRETEYRCRSRAACEKRQRHEAAGTNYGAWGSSPKWGRKRAVQHPAEDGEPA